MKMGHECVPHLYRIWKKGFGKSFCACSKFTKNDLEILESISKQAAIAIQSHITIELKDKEKQKDLLIEYCSKDTLAVYYLVKYLIEKTKT